MVPLKPLHLPFNRVFYGWELPAPSPWEVHSLGSRCPYRTDWPRLRDLRDQGRVTRDGQGVERGWVGIPRSILLSKEVGSSLFPPVSLFSSNFFFRSSSTPPPRVFPSPTLSSSSASRSDPSKHQNRAAPPGSHPCPPTATALDVEKPLGTARCLTPCPTYFTQPASARTHGSETYGEPREAALSAAPGTFNYLFGHRGEL